jgi:hypothetical protein
LIQTFLVFTRFYCLLLDDLYKSEAGPCPQFAELQHRTATGAPKGNFNQIVFLHLVGGAGSLAFTCTRPGRRLRWPRFCADQRDTFKYLSIARDSLLSMSKEADKHIKPPCGGIIQTISGELLRDSFLGLTGFEGRQLLAGIGMGFLGFGVDALRALRSLNLEGAETRPGTPCHPLRERR